MRVLPLRSLYFHETPMITLEISPFEGRSAQEFPIYQSRTSIGRHPTNDVVINRSFISGSHAEILRADDGELTIQDLGSSNGTFVNGERITSSPIKMGDKVQFGDLKGRITSAFEEEESSMFDSLAISQAKKAMKKLDQGVVPGGSKQAVALGGEFLSQGPATETAVSDSGDVEEPADEASSASSLAEIDELKSRIAELEDSESELTEEKESLAEALAEKSERPSEMARELEAKDEAAADAANSEVPRPMDSEEAETLKARISELEDRESELVRSRESLEKVLSEKEESITALETQLAEKQAIAAEEASETSAAASVEIDALRERNAELEKNESVLFRVNENLGKELTAKSDAISELKSDLDQKESALAEKEGEATALRAEAIALQSAHGDVAEACAELGSIQQEIESLEPQRARKRRELDEFLAETAAAKEAAVEENTEVRGALESAKRELEILNRSVGNLRKEESVLTEAFEAKKREIGKQRRAEAAMATRTEKGLAKLASIQREIEGHEPERLRLQQELDDFLAQAEATRAAAIEENAEARQALQESQKQLEAVDDAVRQAREEEKARSEAVLEGIRELETQKRAEADALARVEEKKAASELKLDEVSLSTEAMEEKSARVEAQIAKAEKTLNRINRKIAWRKKLLKRLKTVARREREVEKKMEEAKRVLEGVESHHQPGGMTLSQVQPWDVDQARADREEALEDARRIREELAETEAKLKERQAELSRIEGFVGGEGRPEIAHS